MTFDAGNGVAWETGVFAADIIKVNLKVRYIKVCKGVRKET